MSSTYWELLKDPRWQKKRLEIFSRADFACEHCGSKDKTLNVHHHFYRKNAKPWQYEDSALISLCEECHELQHQWKDRLKDSLDKLCAGGMIEQIVGYLEGMRIAWFNSDEDTSEFGDAKFDLRNPEYANGICDALELKEDGHPTAEICEREPYSYGELFSAHVKAWESIRAKRQSRRA